MKKQKYLLSGLALGVEIILTIVVCVVILINSLNTIQVNAQKYAQNFYVDYNMQIDSYIMTFNMMKSDAVEKIEDGLSFDEMSKWLLSRNEVYKNTIGEETFDGFAFTYDGGYVHSWDYGDYSDYDPNTRPWYQQAREANGEIAVVAPYVTYLDSSIIDSDEYIIMTISQRYSDEISFDYDVKISKIGSLLASRSELFDGTDALLIDDKGYVISSSKDDYYAHNVNEDNSVNLFRDIIKAEDEFSGSDDKLHLRFTEDGIKLMYIAAYDNGNTLYISMPFVNAFLKNILPVILIALLLIMLESTLYHKNKKNLKDLQVRDKRFTTITKAAFEWQVVINVDTMTATLADGKEVPYSDFFENQISVLSQKEMQQVSDFISPKALLKKEPDDAMLSISVSTTVPGNDCDVLRTQELFLLVSKFDGVKIATILCNDISDAERERHQVLSSIAMMFTSVMVGSINKDEYTVLNAAPAFRKVYNTSSYIGTIESLAAQYIRDDYKESYLNVVRPEAIAERFKTENKYEFFFALKSNHWLMLTVVKCAGYEKNKMFIQCVQRADEQMQQQEQLKEALKAAEIANASKTDFLSRMSHDMRTPMNGILGIAELMTDTVNLEEIKTQVDKIKLSGKYLLNLINDTLDVNKIESGKLELHETPMVQKAIIENVLEQIRRLAADKDQIFVSELAIPEKHNWIPIVADGPRIEQILMNLLSNAVKYTPNGGTVMFLMEYGEVEENVIHDHYIIRDTGIGMSEDFQKHMFEPFAQEGRMNTSRESSTGLGLSIVQRLIKLMNGTIEVNSRMGKGTEIRVSLTHKIFHGELKNSAKKYDESVLKDKVVLMCEDHPLNREIAIKLLKRKGIIVETAENGKEGVRKFSGSAEGYYDLILMDLRMPVMDGLAAAKSIRTMERSDAKKVPIIALTANAFDTDVKECMDSGMNAHLAKPIEPEAMYATIAEQLSKNKRICD